MEGFSISTANLRDGGKTVKLFQVRNNDTQQIIRQNRCFQNSLNLPPQFFLKGIICHKGFHTTTFIYEDYETDLAMNDWFQNWNQMKNIIVQYVKGLQNLYETQNICYGEISDRTKYNFVIRENKGFICGVEGHLFPNGPRNNVMVNELMSISTMLSNPPPPIPPMPLDLRMFIDYLQWSESWNLIFSHPYLLDYRNKLYYFILASRYFNDYLGEVDRSERRLLSEEIKIELQRHGIYLGDWSVMVQDPGMIDTLHKGSYQVLHKIQETEFIRFIRNCIAHTHIFPHILGGWNADNVAMFQQAETLVEVIENIYPGHLTDIIINRIICQQIVYIY